MFSVSLQSQKGTPELTFSLGPGRRPARAHAPVSGPSRDLAASNLVLPDKPMRIHQRPLYQQWIVRSDL